ncbi:hypothetical protein Ddye_026956 [Dipteronia dyeriana]|uniref:NB-ARC domain-containing protein n=1 Tax=Dipteronia dyeriana TaxID=168575 RepID=A0AAD9TND1_9ROSI|nr:hypothetical protein Ddye_026956 [Dipteronia dyeriana]
MSHTQRSNSIGTLKQRKEDIITGLKDAKVSKIVFVGDAGMGKSWMARKIIDHEDLWYETLWVYVTEKYDIDLFYTDIARQLFLSCSIAEEWEYEEENSEEKKETALNLKHEKFEWGYKEEEETIESLKKRVQEKMREIGVAALSEEKKYLILVLDNEGNNFINNDLLGKLSEEWISMFHSKFYCHLKIIITTRELGGCNAEQTTKVFEFNPLSPEQCLHLLQECVGTKVSDIQSFKELGKDIAEKSEGMPAAIIVVAEALKCIARHDDSKLESAISKAAYYKKTSQGINPLFYCACDMITNSDTKNCFWHSMHMFRNYGGVHYNELITHWIMEGYFDSSDHIEEKYQKGHSVLMELIGRALLKIQENNIVAVERAALNEIESCLLGFSGTAALRLFSVFKDNKILGRVARMDGMIKTLCNPRNWEKNTALLIDGSRLSREVHPTFFNSIEGLRVLAVFKGRCKSLASFLSKMEKLLVLVLRSCDLLDDITHINQLKTLKVLEISGDSHLMSMPSNLFDEITDLQSLNLSGLQIETLPSISKLSELRVLILRGCSRLKKLQSLRGLGKLQILDISDATSFQRFDDPTLSVLPKIQMINLSNTNIQSLPEFDELQNLTQVFLSGCCSLCILPTLQLLTSLKILDLSGAIMFKTFTDESVEQLDQLRILDLSKTSISKLPSVGLHTQVIQPNEELCSGPSNSRAV